jgi:hypothetical protein
MASRIPARTVWSQRKTLEDYEGTLTEQLGSLLWVTRVNSTNVLDEGLRIGEIGRWMNSKVKLVKISVS